MITGQVKCHLNQIIKMLLPIAVEGHFQRKQLYANIKTVREKECLYDINIYI